MKSLSACEEYKSDTRLVLQENKSKITFLNPNQYQILIIRVDDCVIKDKEILRCDYAIKKAIKSKYKAKDTRRRMEKTKQ